MGGKEAVWVWCGAVLYGGAHGSLCDIRLMLVYKGDRWAPIHLLACARSSHSVPCIDITEAARGRKD